MRLWYNRSSKSESWLGREMLEWGGELGLVPILSALESAKNCQVQRNLYSTIKEKGEKEKVPK